MEPLDGWTSGAPGAQMCVRAYGCRVSVVDVRVFRACARGERLLGVINIIIKLILTAVVTEAGDETARIRLAGVKS